MVHRIFRGPCLTAGFPKGLPFGGVEGQSPSPCLVPQEPAWPASV
jgi:hypothetical protein